MKKKKKLIRIVFGAMLSLIIVVSCSVAVEEISTVAPPPSAPPSAPIGINSTFVQRVKGQESVIELSKSSYAVFNEVGDVTVSSTGEIFTEVSGSTVDSATYIKTTSSGELTLIVNLIMASGNATGANFLTELNGSTINTKFLDTIISEGLAFMDGKILNRIDLEAVQGTMSADGKTFTPSANYGWKSGKSNIFVSYTLDTGVFLYQYTEDPVWSFPSRITVDTSTGLGQLKVDAGNMQDVSFD